jgi:outer membrane receptor protein involved in Fe transport
VRADSYEGGVRGEVAGRLSYEASAYRMAITDDILTYLAETEHGVDRLNTNAGATRHEGVELAAGLALGAGVRLDASWTAARHLYREWAPSATQDFSGNRMESAPRTLSNARLGYAPAWLSGAAAALEWVHVGRYFADPANTVEYPGHDLYNLRLNVPVGTRLEAVLHLTNLLDERYAEGVSMGVAGAEFSPGRPRSINLGLRYRWQRGGE